MLERAIALDPKYAHAHAWKACVLGQSWIYGWCEDKEATWNEVLNELQVALALDDNDADVHRILAAVHVTSHHYDKAVYHQERALGLNPNNDLIVVQQGEILTWLGRAEDGAAATGVPACAGVSSGGRRLSRLPAPARSLRACRTT